MQAAILFEPGRLEIRETPTPECPSGGVLVKVKACGLCSSDVKMMAKGHRALVYPRILGHEMAGMVVESRVREFKAGDRVQVAPGLRCGKCIHCRRGADNQCENREIFGFTTDGGFAEYIPVPLKGPIVGALSLLPESINYDAATLGEPVACCLNAQDKVGIQPGDTVLIIGAGPLGLLHSYVAKAKGAENILVSEIQTSRRKSAILNGADQAIDPSATNLFQTVMDATNEKGIDIIIFACSQTGLDEKFIKLLAPGGRASVFSGMPPQIAQIHLDLNVIHYNEIKISGAYGCTAHQNTEAIKLIASGKLPLGDLITNRVTLDNIAEGLEHTQANRALKSILEVQDE
jgi:L-iditol 2-dehydrogenase